MEGPVSFWGYKEQESNLILPEHDDDDDDKERRYVAVCQFIPSVCVWVPIWSLMF